MSESESRLIMSPGIVRFYTPSPLERVAMKDAGLYSAARHPLPECYPGTRTTIIEEILEWARGEVEEGGDLMWVYGPAGAGKTAIAQTIGQSMDKDCTLAAALFFSRPRDDTDALRFWPSICYQMMQKTDQIVYYFDEAFRIADWQALKETIQDQFHKLIHLPLSATVLERNTCTIIIDGLDECEGEAEQCEIIRYILDVLQTPGLRLGVRWLIFSRPEPHLKHIFETATSVEGLCCTKEVSIDDLETQMDIQIYLGVEFIRIRNAHCTTFKGKERWPKQNDLEKIFQAASGFFIYAVTIVKFVGDPIYKDPISRLQLVVDFIDGSPISPGASNPLAFVDNLYRELIERTPPDVLETTLRILGTCIVCPRLPVVHFAHLLGLSWKTIYEALIFLHSVIEVPSEAKAAEGSLRFFHASFPDFLMNPERSGSLAQDVGLHRLQLTETCFRTLNHSEVSYAKTIMDQGPLELCTEDDDDEDERIPSPLSMAYVILTFTSMHVWELCSRLRSPTPEFLRRTVGSFDFRCLQSVCEAISPQGFVEFLRWLDRSVDIVPELTDIVRTRSCSESDSQLIEAYGTVSQPLVLSSRDIANHLEESARWVLAGFEERSVAIIITHETVMVYLMEDIEPPHLEAELFLHSANIVSRPFDTNTWNRLAITHTSHSTPISEQTVCEFGVCPSSTSTSLTRLLVTDRHLRSVHHPESSDIQPRVDLHEDSEKNLVTIVFELPGVKKEDVQLNVHNDLLTVAAEIKSSTDHRDNGYAIRERRYGKFSRSLRLPQGVKGEEVKAVMVDGILTITFPKTSPEQEPKKINIE